MAVLKNRAKMSTSTTGTGTITLGSAESGYQTFADAGVANADVVRYVIEDGNNWEIGTGTYTATGTTLSRTVSESSNADAAINLSGSATVFIGATAEDIPDLYADNAVNATTPVASGTNAVAIGSSSVANSSAAIALGDSALAYGSDTLVLQKGRASGSQATSIAVHNNSSAYGSNHLGAVSIGSHAKSTQDYSFALGWYSQANANYAMAFGRGANAGHISSVAIGHNAATTSANQIALGSTSDTVKISGTYTLPTSDGTNGQVLTTDGAGAVTFAAAGGGDPDLYRDNAVNATTPTAAGDNGIAIGSNAVNTTTHGSNNGLAIGTNAVADSWATALGAGTDATGDSSLAVGYNSQATGPKSTAIMNSYASGTTAFAAVIDNNTSTYGATGANSIAMGYLAKSQGSTNGSVAIGHNAQATKREGVAIGSSAYATGSAAVALGGYFGVSVQARATGTSSFAVAGYNGLSNRDSTAEGLSSIAMAGGYAQHNQSVAIGAFAHANVRGKVAWSSYPLTNSDGATQAGNYVLSNSTTDATATKLVTDYEWSTPSSTNQVVLPNNSVYGFTGTVIARENSAQTNDFAVWEIKGGAVRAATAATTALGSYNINKISESTGAANWSIALSADTTNGAVAITVTGEALHSIRWVATVNTTEVIY